MRKRKLMAVIGVTAIVISAQPLVAEAAATAGASKELGDMVTSTVSPTSEMSAKAGVSDALSAIVSEVVGKEKIEDFREGLDIYTDMSESLSISKETFEDIMASMPYDYEYFFVENADTMWELASQYGFNELLMPAIQAQESGWGRYPAARNNYSSQSDGNGGYCPFATPEAGIDALANNLATNYLPSNGKYYGGTSLAGINTYYCVENDWATGVCECMHLILDAYINNP